MALYYAKDLASWLGNSVPVAMAHYAMATAKCFQRAIVEGAAGSGAICGSILWVPKPYRAKRRNKKTLVSKGKTGLRWLGVAVAWEP